LLTAWPAAGPVWARIEEMNTKRATPAVLAAPASAAVAQ
jgi:hypothetical protein